jgi:hypothetical protein
MACWQITLIALGAALLAARSGRAQGMADAASSVADS